MFSWPSGFILSGQGLKNSFQVADAPTGDGQRVGTEIEYLHRDIILIAVLYQILQNRDELRLSKTRSPSVGIVDMHMAEVSRVQGPEQSFRGRFLLDRRTSAVEDHFKVGVPDLLHQLNGLCDCINEVGVDMSERLDTVEDISFLSGLETYLEGLFRKIP